MNRLSPRGTATLSFAIVALLAAAVVVWQGLVWLDDRRSADRRTDAVTTAEAQVLDLTTMDAKTVTDRLDAMERRLTGDFKRQFESFSENFVNTVTDDRINAVGEVTGSAISDYDDDSAAVIVASTAEISRGKNGKKRKTQAVERHWRFLVELERSEDEWLISGMEFVQ